jgi:hypothetical protein
MFVAEEEIISIIDVEAERVANDYIWKEPRDAFV